MEIETLFGLPAHPLIVHGAVVLLPLAAVVTVASAVVPRVRPHYAPVGFALAVGAAIAVRLAQLSGASLEDEVDRTELVREHASAADRVLPWAIALVAAAGVVALADPIRRRAGRDLPTAMVTIVLSVASLVTAAGATWAVVDTGHKGAKATWQELDDEGDDDDGDSGGDGDNSGPGGGD